MSLSLIHIFFLLDHQFTQNGQNELHNLKVTGHLEEGGEFFHEVLGMMAEDLDWNEDSLAHTTMNIVINEIDHYLPINYVFYAVMILGYVFNSLFLLALLYFLIFPDHAPMCRCLKKATGLADPLTEADFEYQNSILLTAGDMYITDHFFIECTKHSLQILPLSDIIWVYKHSIFHPYLKRNQKLSYTLRLITRHFVKIQCMHKTKEDADKIIEYLKNSSDDLFVGYSKENLLLAKQKRIKKEWRA